MNTNVLAGWRCPECGHEASFNIEVTHTYTTRVTDDGTDLAGGDVEWFNDNVAGCRECQFEGRVFDFLCREESRRNAFRLKVEHRQELRKQLRSFEEAILGERQHSIAAGNMIELARVYVAIRRLDKQIEEFPASG